MNAFLRASFVTAASVIAMGHVQAEPIVLRIADSLPVGHIISETSTKLWMDLVARRSNGQIRPVYYPSEQLGKAKDMLTLTRAGVVDVGYIGPAYISEKMPLSAVAELPGSARSACDIMNAYWSLAKEGGYLYEHEFKPNKIRPLFIAALPPYQIILGKQKPAAALDTYRGSKLRASGGAQDFVLHEMGAVAVHMAPPSIYEALSRGTIDGALLSFVSVESYKLSELVKSATIGGNFGTVVVTYSMSEKKWNALPKSVQEILANAGDEVTKRACQVYDAREQRAAGHLRTAGVNLTAFAGQNNEALSAIYAKVATEWASSLDKRGKPGTQALHAYRDALANPSKF
jgi:TRAP-type C4-dicarboxylate transport system substrate-binding protein